MRYQSDRDFSDYNALNISGVGGDHGARRQLLKGAEMHQKLKEKHEKDTSSCRKKKIMKSKIKRKCGCK